MSLAQGLRFLLEWAASCASLERRAQLPRKTGDALAIFFVIFFVVGDVAGALSAGI